MDDRPHRGDVLVTDPGNRAQDRIRFDIWSNIHYGCVGRSHGIPEALLYGAQDNGKQADNLSVSLGFLLWRLYGRSLTAGHLHGWIVRVMPLYRGYPNAVKPA